MALIDTKDLQQEKESASRLRGVLRYRLFSICQKGKSAYFIQVILNGERCTKRLPCDGLTDARGLFRRLEQGTVTPCTLADILEDMA